MEKEFISHKQCSILHEIGFKYETESDCIAFHAILEDNKIVKDKVYNSEDYIGAITWRQAFSFFRENNGMYHRVDVEESMQDGSLDFFGVVNDRRLIDYSNYEEAESSCLDKLIELVQSSYNEG